MNMQGRLDAARTAIEALVLFVKYRGRFELIVEGRADPKLPMNRPQVRFDGLDLAENATSCTHAQNDASRLFLWMITVGLAETGIWSQPAVTGSPCLYFEAIR